VHRKAWLLDHETTAMSGAGSSGLVLRRSP
jgi:hypothetical protein